MTFDLRAGTAAASYQWLSLPCRFQLEPHLNATGGQKHIWLFHGRILDFYGLVLISPAVSIFLELPFLLFLSRSSHSFCGVSRSLTLSGRDTLLLSSSRADRAADSLLLLPDPSGNSSSPTRTRTRTRTVNLTEGKMRKKNIV